MTETTARGCSVEKLSWEKRQIWFFDKFESSIPAILLNSFTNFFPGWQVSTQFLLVLLLCKEKYIFYSPYFSKSWFSPCKAKQEVKRYGVKRKNRRKTWKHIRKLFREDPKKWLKIVLNEIVSKDESCGMSKCISLQL